MTLVLHNFFRSSTSTRLRAALKLKGLDYAYVSYALRKGETRAPKFLALNPQGLVPALEREDGRWIYEVKLIDERNRVHELELDAASGAVLEREEK